VGGIIIVTEPLIFAFPSKGRLKDQAEAWLADCGLPVRSVGGERGYAATLEGLEGVEVRLHSASEIADRLISGDIHLGVTGEDLLREAGGALARSVQLLQGLGFGGADLVVAVPRSWIDVADMGDLGEVAHLYLARTGRRLRVATKYPVQTRGFFARHGLAEYRIVESAGATEGAPAAGAAELVVDITTTGATLAANGLKRIGDGLILASQAQLAASLHAPWDAPRLEAARQLVSIVEARSRAKRMAALSWPGQFDAAARAALSDFAGAGAGPFGRLIDAARLFEAADLLARRGVAPLAVTELRYVFEAESPAMAELRARAGTPDRAD
jgi:ATP phosphoribosyltransferase